MKITDFGLARARPISTEQQSLSQEQFSAAGTYAWMAPERNQLLNRIESLLYIIRI